MNTNGMTDEEARELTGMSLARLNELCDSLDRKDKLENLRWYRLGFVWCGFKHEMFATWYDDFKENYEPDKEFLEQCPMSQEEEFLYMAFFSAYRMGFKEGVAAVLKNVPEDIK